jgi:hypothetical protein
MFFLHTTSPFIQTLRLVRILSDQNIKWRLHPFLNYKKQEFIVLSPITREILTWEDDRCDAIYVQ